MKNNNKNRKLDFIRTKNALRLGKIAFYVRGKIRVGHTEIERQWIINNAKKQLFKRFKLELPLFNIEDGYCGDDFVRNMVTYEITLKNH